jgi:hypothetical protein
VSAVVALIVLVPLAAIAYLQEFPRVLAHATLFIAAEFGGTWLEATTVPVPRALTFGGAAVVSAALGVTLLIRFLRQKPIPPAEEAGRA